VYGSGQLTIPQMSRAGPWLNALFIVLVLLPAYALLGETFRGEPGPLPGWAADS